MKPLLLLLLGMGLGMVGCAKPPKRTLSDTYVDLLDKHSHEMEFCLISRIYDHKDDEHCQTACVTSKTLLAFERTHLDILSSPPFDDQYLWCKKEQP